MAKQSQPSLEQLFSDASIRNYVSIIESRIKEVISEQPLELQPAVAYALNSGGKRLRPLLALLCCQAICGEAKPAISVALAYELAHTAALIQDDMIDKSPRRRGKISLWSLLGHEKAILVSDMLLFEIFKALMEYEKTSLSQYRLYRLLELVYLTSKNATAGQTLDIDFTISRPVLEDEYLDMIRMKSGSLLAAPCAAGAIVGGGTDQEVEIFYEFGERLGIAFQIDDDILDIVGDEKLLGKPILNDLRNGKKNLLLIHALSQCSPEEQTFLKSIVGKDMLPTKEVERVRIILEKSNAVAHAKLLRDSIANEARQILSVLPANSSSKLLCTLSFALENRLA